MTPETKTGVKGNASNQRVFLATLASVSVVAAGLGVGLLAGANDHPEELSRLPATISGSQRKDQVAPFPHRAGVPPLKTAPKEVEVTEPEGGYSSEPETPYEPEPEYVPPPESKPYTPPASESNPSPEVTVGQSE